MTIRIQCRCGKRYRVPESRTGQSADCRRCGEELAVPQPAAASAFELDTAQLPGIDEPVLQPVAVLEAPRTSRNSSTTYELKRPGVAKKPSRIQPEVDFANLDLEEFDNEDDIVPVGAMESEPLDPPKERVSRPARVVSVPMRIQLRVAAYALLAWLGGSAIVAVILRAFIVDHDWRPLRSCPGLCRSLRHQRNDQDQTHQIWQVTPSISPHTWLCTVTAIDQVVAKGSTGLASNQKPL